MSAEEEREQEVVSGTVVAVIQKGSDKWQAEIRPNGSQYSKRCWTKSAPQHEALASLIGQPVSILCNVSHWEKDGKPVRSLWVDKISSNGQEFVPPPPRAAEAVTAPQSTNYVPTSAMTLHDPRQTSIERQTAVKVAVEYMALLPEELRSVEQMIEVAERITLFLSDGKAAEPIPF